MAIAEKTAPTVFITEKAAAQVRKLAQTDQPDYHGLRVAVQGGGCSGLVYKLALERSRPGLNVRSAKIWHGAMTSDGGKWFRKRWGKCPKCHSKVQVTVEEEAPPPWIDYPVPFMEEDEILSMRPNGGEYTVAEIVEEYRLFAERLKDIREGVPNEVKGDVLEDAVKKIPLVGPMKIMQSG